MLIAPEFIRGKRNSLTKKKNPIGVTCCLRERANGFGFRSLDLVRRIIKYKIQSKKLKE
jgi:hypothetical protein